MKFTNFLKLFLLTGMLFIAFSFAESNANVTNKITAPAVKIANDTSITSDNYIPHFRKHPRHHRKWWRIHHRRRRHC